MNRSDEKYAEWLQEYGSDAHLRRHHEEIEKEKREQRQKGTDSFFMSLLFLAFFVLMTVSVTSTGGVGNVFVSLYLTWYLLLFVFCGRTYPLYEGEI